MIDDAARRVLRLAAAGRLIRGRYGMFMDDRHGEAVDQRAARELEAAGGIRWVGMNAECFQYGAGSGGSGGLA